MPTIARLQLSVSTTGAARAHAELEALDNHLNRLDQAWRNRVARFVSDRDKEGGAINRVTLIAEQAHVRQARAVERNIDHHGRFGGVLGTLTQQLSRMSARMVIMATVFGGLGVAAFQLGAALAPLIGLAGALPGLLAAGGVAALATGLAFSGMGDALKALSAAEDAAGQDATALAQRQSAAAQAIRSAQRGVRDAEENLRDAQQRARDAQLDLNEARREARQRLEDLRFEQERNALSEERAVLDIAEARQELNRVRADPQADALERRSAELRVREAQQRLRDIRRERVETAAQIRQGVEGSEQVRNAKQAQRSAEEGVRDALQNVADAQESLAQAQRQASQATAQQTTAARNLQQAMADLPGPTAAVVRQLWNMRGMVTQLRDVSAAGIMPGVSSMLRDISGLFPIVRTGIAGVSRVIGDLIARAGAWTRTPAFRRDFAGIMRDNVLVTQRFGNAGLLLSRALLDVAGAARPLVRNIAGMVEAGARWVATATRGARESGALGRFFERAWSTAKLLGGMLADIVTILFNLGRIAAPVGASMLTMLAGWLDRAAKASSNLDGLRRTVLAIADAAIILKAALLGAAFGPWGIAAGAAAGALAVLYRRSEAFRNIVARIGEAVMGVAVPAFRSLVGWVQGQFLPAIRRVIPFVRDQLGQGFRNLSDAISDNRAEFALVGRIILTVAGWILTRLVPVLIRLYAVYLRTLFDNLAFGVRAFGTIVRAIQGAVAVVQRAGQIIGAFVQGIGRAWNLLVSLSRGAWGIFRAVVFDNVTRVRQEIVKSVVGLIPRSIRDGWSNSNRATSEAMGRFRTNVADSMRRALQTVQGWGRSVLSTIRGLAAPLLTAGRNAWNSLLRGIRSIDLVGGIKSLLNSGIGLLNRFGRGIASIGNRLLPGSPIRFPEIARLQQGGRVPGLPRGDRVPILAEGGEFMVRQPVAEPLRMLLEAINRMPASSARALGRVLASSRAPDIGGDPSRLVVSRNTMSRPDRQGTVFAFQRGGVVPPGGGGRQAIRPGLLPLIHRTQQWIRAQDAKPYVWGGVGYNGWDCSGLAGGVYAMLTGQFPHRRYFTTASIPAGTSLRPGTGAYTIGVTPGRGHMAGNLAGLPFEARSTRAGILVGPAARSVMSFARQFYLPSIGGQFIGGGGGLAGLLSAAFERALGGLLRPINGALDRMGGPNDLTGRIVGGMGRRLVDSVVNWVRGLFTFSGGGPGPGTLGGGLSPAERWIIMRESRGNVRADNPTSTAFGLGQLLLANRVHYGRILGVSPNTTDYASQLQMFRMYVRDRYQTAEAAQRFWQAHGWYQAGLDAVINRPTVIGVGEAGPEHVRITPGGRTPEQVMAGAIRDVMRSWVVPWLRRIALAIERRGTTVTRATESATATAVARTQPAGGRLTARQVSALRPDAARWAYVDRYGRPPAPAGWAWAEDETLVPVSFYHQGGTLPEDVWGRGRSGRAYRFQGGETVNPRGGGNVFVTFQTGAVQLSGTYAEPLTADDVYRAMGATMGQLRAAMVKSSGIGRT